MCSQTRGERPAHRRGARRTQPGPLRVSRNGPARPRVSCGMEPGRPPRPAGTMHPMPERARVPVLVVGAGVAGLSCARVLATAGRSAPVLDRARGVGGRCATRRVDDHPM
ncbi:MAG TPA: NAD(P)-binding protein, partial [Anaeromyxobacter sp.]|nr:NAD(P)-binding protein [Anaeromyxobacter sp.]